MKKELNHFNKSLNKYEQPNLDKKRACDYQKRQKTSSDQLKHYQTKATILKDKSQRQQIKFDLTKATTLKDNSQRLKKQKDKTKKLHETNQFALINFKKTKNNLFCSLSSLFGLKQTLWSISGGQIKMNKGSNGRRKTRFTQRLVFKQLIAKMLSLGILFLVIHCKGTTTSKGYIFRNFYKKFKILLLKDLTGVPHNGCRPSNVRRV